MKPYNADFIEVASINEEQPDYYGNYELADVYGGKKRQRFNFKYKYRFKGESEMGNSTICALYVVSHSIRLMNN